MSMTFSILMALAMLSVLGVLGLGIFSMVRGGEFNRKYSNTLMRARVGLQALAILLFVLAVATSHNPN